VEACSAFAGVSCVRYRSKRTVKVLINYWVVRRFSDWGHVAEWLRNGLQNRVLRFNSGRGLQPFQRLTGVCESDLASNRFKTCAIATALAGGSPPSGQLAIFGPVLDSQANSHSATEIAIQASAVSQPNMTTAMIVRKAELDARRFHPLRAEAGVA
jgi:hypothetical protein